MPSFGERVPRSSEIILVNGREVVQKFPAVVPRNGQHWISIENHAHDVARCRWRLIGRAAPAMSGYVQTLHREGDGCSAEPEAQSSLYRSSRSSLGFSHSFLLSPATILYRLNHKEKVRKTQ